MIRPPHQCWDARELQASRLSEHVSGVFPCYSVTHLYLKQRSAYSLNLRRADLCQSSLLLCSGASAQVVLCCPPDVTPDYAA